MIIILVEVLRAYSKQQHLKRIIDRLAHNQGSRPVPDPGGPRSGTKRAHKVRQRLTPDAIQQLVSDYEAGNSMRTLMAIYDLGKGLSSTARSAASMLACWRNVA